MCLWKLWYLIMEISCRTADRAQRRARRWDRMRNRAGLGGAGRGWSGLGTFPGAEARGRIGMSELYGNILVMKIRVLLWKFRYCYHDASGNSRRVRHRAMSDCYGTSEIRKGSTRHGVPKAY